MLDLSLDGRVFLDDEIDCAIQEIDMLLNTENTQLIGYPEYGTEFQTFLWTLTPTTMEIENYIKDKISTTLFASKMDVGVKAKFIQGDYTSVYYIKIIIVDKKGNTRKREYKYQ